MAPTPGRVSTHARPTAPPPPAKPLTEEEIFARESLDQLNGEHPLGDAFFDYDSATLSPEARASGPVGQTPISQICVKPNSCQALISDPGTLSNRTGRPHFSESSRNQQRVLTS